MKAKAHSEFRAVSVAGRLAKASLWRPAAFRTMGAVWRIESLASDGMLRFRAVGAAGRASNHR